MKFTKPTLPIAALIAANPAPLDGLFTDYGITGRVAEAPST